MTIPASQIVQINPGIVGGGGNALDLNGLIISQNANIPLGSVPSFPTLASVQAFFGYESNEAAMAAVYFVGRNNATVMPGALLFAPFNEAAAPAWLQGGSLASMTLTQLQALSGTLDITFNGTPLASSAINLSAATSFSEAATLIAAGFTSPPFGVEWNAQLSCFQFTSTATGATETTTFATGTLAAGLYLTQATGAVISQGAAPQTPAGLMNQVITVTQNWGAFTTAYDDTTANKIAYALWNNSQNNRYAYVGWGSDAAALSTPDTTTFMATVQTDNYSGTVGVYCDPVLDPQGLAAAMVLGYAASLNFSQTNGRATAAFKSTDGVPASVSNPLYVPNLESNGYNYVGSYATANQGFTFFYPGKVSGEFDWLDTYLNQVYLNSQLQLAVMELLTQVNSIPYNATGYSLIHAACMDPINQMLNFGGIQPNVSLSSAQAAEVNNAAGATIAPTLSTRGWYLQINNATSQVRAARSSPPMTLWYMDGGSVQQVTLASIVVQ